MAARTHRDHLHGGDEAARRIGGQVATRARKRITGWMLRAYCSGR